MGYPVPELPDGLYDWLRKLIAASIKLSRERAPDGVKTHRVIHAVWESDPSRSPLELYADIIRQAQDWIVRYPLFETQGNFGSIDGDTPAGMRYNEVSPSPWMKLGPAFPLLLANGGIGHTGEIETDAPPGTKADPVHKMEPLISYVPLGRMLGGVLRSFLLPHNMKEIAGALELLMDHADSTLSDILQVLPGPDFPTGGILTNVQELDRIYRSGEGSLVLRARTNLVKLARGRTGISLTQIPYGMTVTRIIEAVAEQIKAFPDFGITDISCLSSRSQSNVLFQLREDQPPQAMLDFLQTQGIFENKVEVHMVVLRDRRETPVGLLDLLRSHLERRLLHLGSKSKLRRELTLLAKRSDVRRTTIASG
jgi:DNA gyrase subunit A